MTGVIAIATLICSAVAAGAAAIAAIPPCRDYRARERVKRSFKGMYRPD